MFNSLLDLMPEPGSGRTSAEPAPRLAIEAGGSVPQEHLGGDYVFIVLAGVVSKLQVSESGHLSEIGMVGNEGLFPLSGLLGVPAAPHIVVCQVVTVAGATTADERLSPHSEQLRGCARALLRKYIYSFITQIASNIASSEQGMVSAKLARWLLMCHDRIDGDCIPITHDMLAQIIFAHRPHGQHRAQDDAASGPGRHCARRGDCPIAIRARATGGREIRSVGALLAGPHRSVREGLPHADEDRLPQQGQLRA